MSETVNRPYSSPLREAQAQRTREQILDALSELLADYSPHEISTREIAERAGVSQPTVYRHFPDRQALIEGLAGRLTIVADADDVLMSTQHLDDAAAHIVRLFLVNDEHAIETMADALLNTDPRRYSEATRAATAGLRRAVAEAFPNENEHEHNRITALLRSLVSVQTWLRMREEFGIPGDEAGPIIGWAVDTLVREIRAGNFPDR